MRSVVGMLAVLTACTGCVVTAADWYSVRLLANPIVQPVTNFVYVAAEAPRTALYRTGAKTARCVLTNDFPMAATELASLDGVSTLRVDAGVRVIADGAFARSASLETVVFEGQVRQIGFRSFADSTNLVTVVLEEATSTFVAADAFAGCSRELTCRYPFSPVMTAQDGAELTGRPIFPRILFRRLR